MSLRDILHGLLLACCCCEAAIHRNWLMVQARLAGCISDCLHGVPQRDRRGVLLWPPGFDPRSEGVEQVRNLDSHISHNLEN